MTSTLSRIMVYVMTMIRPYRIYSLSPKVIWAMSTMKSITYMVTDTGENPEPLFQYQRRDIHASGGGACPDHDAQGKSDHNAGKNRAQDWDRPVKTISPPGG